jgi:hypothetical protein
VKNSLLLLATLTALACHPAKHHNLFLRSSDKLGTTYSFTMTGPTFHVPSKWAAADPLPGHTARFIRSTSDGASAHCWFDGFVDTKYVGLTGEQVLKQFHDPTRILKPAMADTATLSTFDYTRVGELPAVRSVWASTSTYRGIQVPIRTRVVSIAYKSAVISSVCVATDYDSKLIATELDDIQLSFRPAEP